MHELKPHSNATLPCHVSFTEALLDAFTIAFEDFSSTYTKIDGFSGKIYGLKVPMKFNIDQSNRRPLTHHRRMAILRHSLPEKIPAAEIALTRLVQQPPKISRRLAVSQ